jgi:ABC-2 type transport system ATP-binding protein
MLSGVLHPTSGSVEVLGFKPYERNYEYLNRIGMVLGQKSQLASDLPPRISFELNRDIYGISNEQFETTINELIDLLEVKQLMDVQVRKMSLGERMKFELILALVHSPEVLYLDEPTIGLDIHAQKGLREFIKQYNERYKATIILTSHNMDDVKRLCKRIMIINGGQLVYDGTIFALYEKFSNEKNIDITFEKMPEKSDLEKFGRVLSIEDEVVKIAIDKGSHSQIVAALLTKYEVHNIDITEPSLEDIISRFYDKK